MLTPSQAPTIGPTNVAPTQIPTISPTYEPSQTAQPSITLPPSVEVDVIVTIAGTGSTGFSGDGGPATSATLNLPAAVAINRNNSNMYIADWYNSLIRVVNSTSGDINTIGGCSTSYTPASGDGGPATSAVFDPISIALDSIGNVYISDNANQRIRKITISTGVISTYAGTGNTGFNDNSAATSCSLNNPSGITFDGGDNLYIADNDNNRIRQVSSQSMIMTTVAGSDNTASYFGDGGQATSAALKQPHGVTVDSSNNIYISDTTNQRVRKVAHSNSIITTIAGNGYTTYGVNTSGPKSITGGYNGDNIPATNARLNRPFFAILEEDTAIMYIADTYNNRIRKVDLTTSVITTVAGTGSTSYNGDNIVATSANLNYPSFLAFDVNGNMILVDEYNNRIRRLAQSSTPAPFCPKGTFNNTATYSCEPCPRGYYSDEISSYTCKSCPVNYLTPDVGSTGIEDCFSPYMNFALGLIALIFVVGIICMYIPTARYLRIGLVQFYNYCNGKLIVCKDTINKVLTRNLSGYKAEYDEIIIRNASYRDTEFVSGKCINTVLFIVKSAVAVSVLTTINCVFALIQILFGSMIIWRDFGGEIGLSYRHIMTHQARKLDYLVEKIAMCFVDFFSVITSLSIDPVEVYCEGPRSIILFAIYLFIIGVIVIVIVSDLNVVYNCVYLVLHEKRMRCFHFKLFNRFNRLSTDIRTKWYVQLFRTFPKCIGLTAANILLASRPIIWLSFAFVGCVHYYKLVNFYPFYNGFDNTCRDVYFGRLIDASLAGACTILVFILVIPGVYCLADVFVPYYYEELLLVNRLDKGGEATDDDDHNQTVNRISFENASNISDSITRDIEDQSANQENSLPLLTMPKYSGYNYYFPLYSENKWQYIMGKLAIDKNVLRALHWYVKYIQSPKMELNVFRRILEPISYCYNWISATELPPSGGSSLHKKKSPVSFKEQCKDFYTYKMPQFYSLSSKVCQELSKDYSCTPWHYIAVFLAYSGVGHILTPTGRYYWKRVVDKYWIFLRVCFGIWSSKEYASYKILANTYAYTLNLDKSDTIGFSREAPFDPNTLMWSLISIRIVLLLLVPKLSIFCIFVINTAHVPLFTTDSDFKTNQSTLSSINNFYLKFNPWSPFSTIEVQGNGKMERISSYMVDYSNIEKSVLFHGVIFAYELMRQSRILNWIYGCVLTTLSIGILFDTETLIWAYSGWVVILPVCFIQSLWVVIHLARIHSFIKIKTETQILKDSSEAGVAMTERNGNEHPPGQGAVTPHRLQLHDFFDFDFSHYGFGSISTVAIAKHKLNHNERYFAIKLFKTTSKEEYENLADELPETIRKIREIRKCISEKMFVIEPYEGSSLCEGDNNTEFTKTMLFKDIKQGYYEKILGFVMNFEEGYSLAYSIACGKMEYNREYRNITVKLGYLADIAAGLVQLHDCQNNGIMGIAHGDIKPSSIILHPKRIPSVTFVDFDHAFIIVNNDTSNPPASKSVKKDTLRYTAPELFCDKIDDNDSRDIENIKIGLYNATKEADMYAFGLLCWEVLMPKDKTLTWESFLENDRYSNRPLDEVLKLNDYKRLVIDKTPEDTLRPDATLLCNDLKNSVAELLTKCWDAYPSVRYTASKCHEVLTSSYELRKSTDYHVFLSHPWADKRIVRHVKDVLTGLDKRVWYDQNDMSGELNRAMKEGIKNSKLFIACINIGYQNSKNCMLELREAVRLKKPIIVIIIEKESNLDLNKWANDELKRLCRLDFLYCNLSDIYKNWVDEGDASYDMQLGKLRDTLIKEFDIKYEIETRSELVSSKVIHSCSRFFCPGSGSNESVNTSDNSRSTIGSIRRVTVNSPFQHSYSTK